MSPRKAAADGAPRRTNPEVWADSVGVAPFRVVVEEKPARDYVLYLRWTDPATDNHAVRSLKRKLRDDRGKLLPARERKEIQAWALGEAEAKRQQLVASATTEQQEEAQPKRPLTLGEAEALITDPKTGRYRTDGKHRRQVLDALRAFVRVNGAGTPWEAVRRAELRRFWRDRMDAVRARAAERRAKELKAAGVAAAPAGQGPADSSGLAGPMHDVAYVNAVAQWLRDEEHIPNWAAVPPREWRQLLQRDWEDAAGPGADAKPKRPRHTLEEMRLILDKAAEVEPRIGLLLELGLEQRARTQVLRAWRSHLQLDVGRFGMLKVPGAGKKRGANVRLTEDQRAAVDAALRAPGYLHALEARYQEEGTDYPLFPGGKLARPLIRRADGTLTRRRDMKGPLYAEPSRTYAARPATPDWAGRVFEEVEVAAGIDHLHGRGFYGLRRVGTQGAIDHGVTGKALEAWGGWADEQMPRRVYADQEMERAEEEAAEARARVRGARKRPVAPPQEPPPAATADRPTDATPANTAPENPPSDNAVNGDVNTNGPADGAVHGESA